MLAMVHRVHAITCSISVHLMLTKLVTVNYQGHYTGLPSGPNSAEIQTMLNKAIRGSKLVHVLAMLT